MQSDRLSAPVTNRTQKRNHLLIREFSLFPFLWTNFDREREAECMALYCCGHLWEMVIDITEMVDASGIISLPAFYFSPSFHSMTFSPGQHLSIINIHIQSYVTFYYSYAHQDISNICLLQETKKSISTGSDSSFSLGSGAYQTPPGCLCNKLSRMWQHH